MNPWNERIRIVRGRLGIDQEEMGRKLGVSREWVSKLERGHESPSREIREAVLHLEHSNKVLINEPAHLNSGGLSDRVNEPQGTYSGGVASRFPEKQRKPSTRVDCERYVQQLFTNAELSEDPDAFPVILSRLKKQLPLDEWEEKNEP